MLRPALSRLPPCRETFPRLKGSLSSSCTASITPKASNNLVRHRRASSSSSSAPPSGNESNALPAANSTTTRKKGTFSKAGSRLKSKESLASPDNLQVLPISEKKNESFAIPSVPSTQHLQLQDIHLASLFAFHRPISIHHPLPQTVSNKSFGQIFNQKPTQSKPQGEALSATILGVMKDIEKGSGASLSMVGAQVVVNESMPEAKSVDKKQRPIFLHGEEIPVDIDIQSLVRFLRPYSTPPAPKRPASRKSRAHTASIVKMEEFFTPSSVEILEILDSEHSLPLPAKPMQPFLERMRVRRMGYVERNHEIIQALSVRRQRKLKMKKHKYKKLMKRTRNLRKKHDKL